MSHAEILAENRYNCKRHAAIPNLGQFAAMPRTGKPAKVKEPKSELQRLFMSRLNEEMAARGLNANQVGEIGYGLGFGKHFQRTVDDVIKGSDPRLQTIERIAKALSQVQNAISAWQLLRLSDKRVVPLREPLPKIMYGSGNKSRKVGDRKDR